MDLDDNVVAEKAAKWWLAIALIGVFWLWVGFTVLPRQSRAPGAARRRARHQLRARAETSGSPDAVSKSLPSTERSSGELHIDYDLYERIVDPAGGRSDKSMPGEIGCA